MRFVKRGKILSRGGGPLNEALSSSNTIVLFWRLIQVEDSYVCRRGLSRSARMPVHEAGTLSQEIAMCIIKKY